MLVVEMANGPDERDLGETYLGLKKMGYTQTVSY